MDEIDCDIAYYSLTGIHYWFCPSCARWRRGDKFRYLMFRPDRNDKRQDIRCSCAELCRREVWAERDRERARAEVHNQRAEQYSLSYDNRDKYGQVGMYNAWQGTFHCASYGHRFLCCGYKEELTVDHIVPISRGGRNVISNVQALCRSCNSKKGPNAADYRDQARTLLRKRMLERGDK